LTVQISCIIFGCVVTLMVQKNRLMDILPYTLFLIALSVGFFEEDTLTFIPLTILIIYPRHFRSVFSTAVFMLFFDDKDTNSTHGYWVIATLLLWWFASRSFIGGIHNFFRMDLRSEQIGLGGIFSSENSSEVFAEEHPGLGGKIWSLVVWFDKNFGSGYKYFEKFIVAVMALYHLWGFESDEKKSKFSWI
jgi:hypothetical protein